LEVFVKIYGYPNQGCEVEPIAPKELAEITLVANPNELRRIAKFLENCATGMDSSGKSWEHEHLSDKDKHFSDSPHFVVFNPDYGQ